MSDHDELPDLLGPLPLDLQRSTKPVSLIPTTKFVRPCESIEPEMKEFDGMTTIAMRFAARRCGFDEANRQWRPDDHCTPSRSCAMV